MKLLATVAGLLLLTACGTGPGMMNNRSTDGYRYSRPTCTAPANLASASCAAGAGDGIAAGAVGWLTLDLAPGHYELICNLANHYADAMYQELTVTGP